MNADKTRIVLVLAKDPVLPSLDETLFAQPARSG